MTNSILLDKNIVLDIIIGRSRRPEILQILKNYDTHFISTNTFTTCFYVLRKEKFSKEQIYSYLIDFEILEIDKTDCHLAYNLAQNLDDIEDCLELFTAKRNHCKIMSSDQKLIQKYGQLFDTVEV